MDHTLPIIITMPALYLGMYKNGLALHISRKSIRSCMRFIVCCCKLIVNLVRVGGVSSEYVGIIKWTHLACE